MRTASFNRLGFVLARGRHAHASSVPVKMLLRDNDHVPLVPPVELVRRTIKNFKTYRVELRLLSGAFHILLSSAVSFTDVGAGNSRTFTYATH